MSSAILAQQDGGGDTGAGLVLLILLFAAYFIPTLVAYLRRAKKRARVLVVNVFLGWTFIGWWVALALAVSSHREIKRPADSAS